jgi:hypothetical protein
LSLRAGDVWIRETNQSQINQSKGSDQLPDTLSDEAEERQHPIDGHINTPNQQEGPQIDVHFFRRANWHYRVGNRNLVGFSQKNFSQKKSPDPTIKIGFLLNFLGKPDFRRVPVGLLTKCSESSFGSFASILLLIGLF